MPVPKIAVVTGGNRGIGFEICRELAKLGIGVILTSRNEEKGKAAVDTLKKEGLKVTFHTLDVTNPKSIETLKTHVQEDHGRLDILVNNAGILIDSYDPATFNQDESSLFKTNLDTIRTTMETNVYGPILLIQAFVPLMQLHNYGRIVNISSGMGQLYDMNGSFTGYRMSKTGLNVVTRIAGAELKNTNIKINSMCPGWVKTDMGGPNANRTPKEGAQTAVWLATLPEEGPSGEFFRDQKSIPW